MVMYWTSWKPNKMRFPKQHQRKKENAEIYTKNIPLVGPWHFIEACAIWQNFDELLCILMKMFGRECIKYDNGNLSSNFWIGFASSLSLNQMLPAALVFKHKMQLNLLLPWKMVCTTDSFPAYKWKILQKSTSSSKFNFQWLRPKPDTEKERRSEQL